MGLHGADPLEASAELWRATARNLVLCMAMAIAIASLQRVVRGLREVSCVGQRRGVRSSRAVYLSRYVQYDVQNENSRVSTDTFTYMFELQAGQKVCIACTNVAQRVAPRDEIPGPAGGKN